MLNTGLLILCYFSSIFSTKGELWKSKTKHPLPHQKKKKLKINWNSWKKNTHAAIICFAWVCNSILRTILCKTNFASVFIMWLKRQVFWKGGMYVKNKPKKKYFDDRHYGNKIVRYGRFFHTKRRQIAYMYSNRWVYYEIVITSQTSDCRIFVEKAIFGPRLR